MYKRVLIATDGSLCSQQVIQQGVTIAKKLDLPVVFLFVAEDPLLGNAYASPAAASYSREIFEEVRQAGVRALAQAVEFAVKQGVICKTILVERKDPAITICDLENESDLVIMGTHGRRGIQRLMLGSVTEEVMRRSNNTHLIVRCKAPDEVEASNKSTGESSEHQLDDKPIKDVN